MPAFLNLDGRDFNWIDAENFTCRLSWSISSNSSQFCVEMCVASKNCENLLKTPFGGSFKVMDVNKSKKPVTIVLVMISSMSVSICNRFHGSHYTSQ